MNIYLLYLVLNFNIYSLDIHTIFELWGLGIGDWGLGIGTNPQSPIPNPHVYKMLITMYNIDYTV